MVPKSTTLKKSKHTGPNHQMPKTLVIDGGQPLFFGVRTVAVFTYSGAWICTTRGMSINDKILRTRNSHLNLIYSIRFYGIVPTLTIIFCWRHKSRRNNYNLNPMKVPKRAIVALTCEQHCETARVKGGKIQVYYKLLTMRMKLNL